MVTSHETKAAFSKLIQENRRIIFKICNAYCAKKEDRDDLAQEMVYELWKSFKGFNADYKFTTWMYRVALNVAISFYRKEKKSAGTIIYSETLLEFEDEQSTSVETEDNFNLMHQFINQLKAIDKSIMILYLDDKSYREIAEITGITETNVSTRINRVKEILRTQFSKHYNHSYGTK